MPEILCTECGEVGQDKAGRCASCGGALVLPGDAPAARKFIDARNARKVVAASTDMSAGTAATGKVLGRALGKLLKK